MRGWPQVPMLLPLLQLETADVPRLITLAARDRSDCIMLSCLLT